MKSNETCLLDLERGIPTTAEDVRALRRRPAPFPASFAPYFRFLAEFETTPAELRARKGPRGEPFSL